MNSEKKPINEKETISQYSYDEPPAMGERRARWGYGYQDKIVTERILNIIRESLRLGDNSFRGVRLADLEAGRVDDFVLLWDDKVEGNSIKWSEEAKPFNWGELIGSNGLLKELAEGFYSLSDKWKGKNISVRLQSNRPFSSARHHAQLIPEISIADFKKDHWDSGPTDIDSPEIKKAWEIITEHVGLSGLELIQFLNSCKFILGYPEPLRILNDDSQDWKHYKKQFDDLHKAIATWFTNNPKGDFIDKDFLFSAIGFRPYRSRLVQKFPPPEIPYVKNRESAKIIKALINNTKGGYLAITGPAGIGKSTLVQDILSDVQYPYFIPYYAFLPETIGNRDRGEALTFFQDITERLGKYFKGLHSIGVSDISQGREALYKQMQEANKEYVISGKKTILLIDGLDHVSREINLQTPLLQELPDPNEIPDGFLIVLSSQPQGLIPGVISVSLSTALKTGSKLRVEIDGLSKSEVNEILLAVDKPTTIIERESLYQSCLGNPLILTYLLNLFQRNPETTIDQIIDIAGHYDGDISKYYESILGQIIRDAKTKNLLGLLCRAAPTIPITWLQNWEEHSEVEDIYDKILSPFVVIQNNNLRFIHNSLIAFLKFETRTKLPGADSSIDENKFHSKLANYCKGYSFDDPVGQARFIHLLKAGRLEELLDLLTNDPTGVSELPLRKALENFLPYTIVHPILLSGLEAAWKLGKLDSCLRLILLDHELDHRTSRMDIESLAVNLLELDKPLLAISQIQASGKLIANDEIVLKFVVNLWRYSTEKNDSNLKEIGRNLYFQAKPTAILIQNDPIIVESYNDHYKILLHWCSTAPFFEDYKNIISQINKLKFKPPKYEKDINENSIKCYFFYKILVRFVELGEKIETLQDILFEIKKLDVKYWIFASHFFLARHNIISHSDKRLNESYEKTEKNIYLELKYSSFLLKNGYKSKSKKIVEKLPYLKIDGTRNDHQFGFSDISYNIQLSYLQYSLNLNKNTIFDVEDKYQEAYARIQRTAIDIGIFSAKVKMGHEVKNLRKIIRNFLIFNNIPVVFPEYDWRNDYAVSQSKIELFQAVVYAVSLIGLKGIETLRDIFLELIESSAEHQFLDHHKIYFAEVFWEHSVLPKEKIIDIGLSATKGVSDDDPMQRQESCFDISIFFHTIGEDGLSEQWRKRAVKVTAGAAYEKDYHISFLAKLLKRSSDTSLNISQHNILEKFARAIEMGGGDGKSDAAKEILLLLLSIEPIKGFHFAIELIDRYILNASQIIETLILGGVETGASKELLLGMFNELLSLIDPQLTPEAASAILKSFPMVERTEKALEIMKSVRTNSLPSQRIEIAREFQGLFLEANLNEIDFTEGLSPGQHESSMESSLYKLKSGEKKTIHQMVRLLSDHENKKNWNPNPDENDMFRWTSVIKKIRVTNERHLIDILECIPIPEYNEIEILCWKSEKYFKFGNREKAQTLADNAIKLSKAGSWHQRFDSAQKMMAFGALKRINKEKALGMARKAFGKDLGSGKLNTTYLLHDIIEIFDFLELEWPNDSVYKILDDYIDQILSANKDIPKYESLIKDPEKGDINEALCHFLIYLLGFPIVDIGLAARRILAKYAATDGNNFLEIVKKDAIWNTIQLEHILICLHISSKLNKSAIDNLKIQILSLNNHNSVGVRCVARRICEEQRWPWKEIDNLNEKSIIIQPDSLDIPDNYREASLMMDGGISVAYILHKKIFSKLEEFGVDIETLRSEFYRYYREIRSEYKWKNDDRINLWKRAFLTNFMFKDRVIIGREAAMMVLGMCTLTGNAPPKAESSYDAFFPLYDPKLELIEPIERPTGMEAMEWRFHNDSGKKWLAGENADSWHNYPETIHSLSIIGERTWFIRPEWEWPREERYRGLLLGSNNTDTKRSCLKSNMPLTIESYLMGFGQKKESLITLNSESLMDGPIYRWAAFNSLLAIQLGWRASEKEPFKWMDKNGNLMVKSIFWKDGWIWLEPPKFEALGEGWLVLATDKALKKISEMSRSIQVHLWVKRRSHREKTFKGDWHLEKEIRDI